MQLLRVQNCQSNTSTAMLKLSAENTKKLISHLTAGKEFVSISAQQLLIDRSLEYRCINYQLQSMKCNYNIAIKASQVPMSLQVGLSANYIREQMPKDMK